MPDNNNYKVLMDHVEKSAVKAIIKDQEANDEHTRKPRVQLTPRQWREIELLWAAGEVTLRQLSARYGKTKDTFAAHFKKKGIKKGERAQELARAAEEVAKEQAQSQAKIIADRIAETKEEHYRMAEAIAKLTFREVLACKKENRPYRTILQDLKSLQVASETIKRAREERWVTLGLDKEQIDEDSLPELVVSAMTPEQVEALRSVQNEELEEVGFEESGSNALTEEEEGV